MTLFVEKKRVKGWEDEITILSFQENMYLESNRVDSEDAKGITEK